MSLKPPRAKEDCVRVEASRFGAEIGRKELLEKALLRGGGHAAKVEHRSLLQAERGAAVAEARHELRAVEYDGRAEAVDLLEKQVQRVGCALRE